MVRDPYKTLEVSPNASDEELRSAYRRLVQRHHPDHNQGSPESARRFEEIQEAYAQIRELRESPAARARARGGPAGAGTRQDTQPPVDPAVEARLADLERQVREGYERARREAEKARERARQAARDAVSAGTGQPTDRAARATDRTRRPTDEELGYIKTDDSVSKILSDARDELAQRISDAQDELAHRLSDARERPVAKRVSDLIEGLDELASKLDHDRRSDAPKPHEK